jgi:hypothetical protein
MWIFIGHPERMTRFERELLRILREIADALKPPKAHSAKLDIMKTGGFMPLTLKIGDTFTARLHEFTGPDGSGSELPPVGTVSFSSEDSSIATVDPLTGAGVAVAPGTAKIIGTDGGNGLSAGDVVTVAEPTAVSAILELTTPHITLRW